MPKNLGIDIKIKSVACSEPKLQFGNFTIFWVAIIGHFGHSGQSGVSEKGPNRFPVPKTLGIDIKIKYVACSEAKL